MTEASASPVLQPVLVVAGPTAVGKTELAAELAVALDAEVISADSRQVYRYMDVGTAKPPADLRRDVAHHLVDVVDPDEPFDAATWCDAALDALAAIRARGRRAIVCGGTGLYIRSLVRGLFSGPAADPALRERLEAEERAAPGSLHDRLASIDARAAARIHANDLLRIVRALEVFELTGTPLSDWHDAHRQAAPRFEVLTLEVGLPRPQLYRRIDERSRHMVDAGLVDELAALRARGYASDLKAFSAIGYREAGLCLDGALATSELGDEVARATRNYAKRQLVWLRGEGGAQPVASGDVTAARDAARAFFDLVAKRQGIG